MPSVRPASARWCCSRPITRISSSSSPARAQHPYFQGVAPDFSLNNPYVVAGLLFGGMLPYLFGAMGMTAVGRAAASIVEEVRRQFRERPGHHAGQRQAGLRPRRRYADQSRDQGNDHAVAAAGALADRRLFRHLLRRRRRRAGQIGGVLGARRACCSA